MGNRQTTKPKHHKTTREAERNWQPQATCWRSAGNKRWHDPDVKKSRPTGGFLFFRGPTPGFISHSPSGRKRSRRNGGREASDLRGVRAADAAPATRPLETGGFVGLGHGDWAGHGLLLVVFVCWLFGKPKGTYVVVVFLPYLGFPLFHLGAQRDSDREPTHGWKLVGFPIPALCQAVFPPPDPPSQKLTAKMLER